jgi:hypothetical protein
LHQAISLDSFSNFKFNLVGLAKSNISVPQAKRLIEAGPMIPSTPVSCFVPSSYGVRQASVFSAGHLHAFCRNRVGHGLAPRTGRKGARMAFRPEEVPLPPDDYVKPPAEVPLLSTKGLAPYEWPERVRIVALCFASFVLCNCDRINISVAILPMASTFGWSQSTVGIIQSSFFWGYVTTQIPGGYLSDRYGGRQVLAFGVVAWSLMTVLTPAAASTSLPVLLAARALLGVGEGVAMPAMNQVLSRWVPRGERSKSLSLVYSGMYLGSTIGLLSCPILIANFGWQSVFYCFGAAGGLWWFAWNSLTAGSPQSSTTISESERQYIEVNTAPVRPRPLESIPWKMLLSEKATWAIIVAHFCCTWGSYRTQKRVKIWISSSSPLTFNVAISF